MSLLSLLNLTRRAFYLERRPSKLRLEKFEPILVLRVLGLELDELLRHVHGFFGIAGSMIGLTQTVVSHDPAGIVLQNRVNFGELEKRFHVIRLFAKDPLQELSGLTALVIRHFPVDEDGQLL